MTLDSPTVVTSLKGHSGLRQQNYCVVAFTSKSTRTGLLARLIPNIRDNNTDLKKWISDRACSGVQDLELTLTSQKWVISSHCIIWQEQLIYFDFDQRDLQRKRTLLLGTKLGPGYFGLWLNQASLSKIFKEQSFSSPLTEFQKKHGKTGALHPERHA